MINIINENLFSFNTEERENEKTGDTYYKLSINSSSKIVRKNQNGELVHTIRTFATLFSPEKAYSNYNTLISVKDSEDGRKRFVTLKAVKESSYNANVFMVAFPFNGIIKPIPFNKVCRIHKGMISISDDYNIQFNGRNYHKVLYLMLEPYMKIFAGDENHEAVDHLDIPIESYSIVRDKRNPSNPPKSNHEVMTIHITKDGYTVTWKTELVDFVDMSQYKSTPLYQLYTRPNANTNTSSNSNTTPNPNYHNQRPYNTNQNTQYAPNNKDYDSDDDDSPAKRVGNRGKKSKRKY